MFDLIVRHVPEPKQIAKKDEPFQILNVLIESDPFLGRLLTGRIESGKAVPGMAIKALDRNGKEIERGRITKVLAFRGLKRSPVDEGAEAGDIVAIAGMSKATVADTLCALEVTEALPAQPIDPPTISMTVSVNDSPLAGREGDKVQSPRHPRPPAEGSRVERGHQGHRDQPKATLMKCRAAANCSWAS